MNKQELTKRAERVFKYHPEFQEVLATSDGQFFSMRNKQHAREHARKHGLDVVTISRKDGAESDPINLADYTVKEVEAWAEEQSDINLLKQGLESVDTKGGAEAINNRIWELENPES